MIGLRLRGVIDGDVSTIIAIGLVILRHFQEKLGIGDYKEMCGSVFVYDAFV